MTYNEVIRIFDELMDIPYRIDIFPESLENVDMDEFRDIMTKAIDSYEPTLERDEK